MKLKNNFFLIARMTLLMSAFTIISETPAVLAAASTSTAAHAINGSILNRSADQAPILVSNYVNMLQELATRNADEEFYDAASMSDKILCTLDGEGNRIYQAVEGKGSELMQGLTSDDLNCFNVWLSHQIAEKKESAFTVASADKAKSTSGKTATDAAAGLLLTPSQFNKIKNTDQTLGKLTHHSLANNVFEQKAILTAIMSYLTSLGLGASASTINTAANCLGYAAAALVAIGVIPILAEFGGHMLEGRVRSRELNANNNGVSTSPLQQNIKALIDQEALNKKNTDIIKENKKANEPNPIMVYGYLSPMGQKLSSFATNWRSFWSPSFKLIGMNIDTDELHLPYNEMNGNNVSNALRAQQKQAENMSQVFKHLSQEVNDQILLNSSVFSVATTAATSNAVDVLQSLRTQRQGCLTRSFRYCTDGVANYCSGKLAALDDWWEHYQMEIRNGGFKPESNTSGNNNIITSYHNNNQSLLGENSDEEHVDSDNMRSGNNRDQHVNNMKKKTVGWL